MATTPAARPSPVLVTLTMPRAGTTLLHSLSKTAWGDAVRVEHEPLQHAARLRHFFRCFEEERRREAMEDPAIGEFVRGVERDARSRSVLLFGNTLSHLAPLLADVVGDRLRLLHLHRNPVATSASIYVKSRPEWWDIPGFEDAPYGLRISPFDPPARFVEYRERWSSMSRFERILYQWLERNAFAVETGRRYPETPFLSIRSEELFADVPGVFRRIAEFAGLALPSEGVVEESGRQNRAWQRSLEQRPLDDRWRAYESHPRVLELARALGHPLDPGLLERQMEKYQLPPGLLPWLRHATRFWDVRRSIAESLRGVGVLPPQPEDRAGLPPRSLASVLRDAFGARGDDRG